MTTTQFQTRLAIARRQAALQDKPSELGAKIDEIEALFDAETYGVDRLVELLTCYAQLERAVEPANWQLGVRRNDEEERRNYMELTRLVHIALICISVPITSQVIRSYRKCEDDRWVGWWLVNTLSLRLEPESREFLQEVAGIYKEAQRALGLLDQNPG